MKARRFYDSPAYRAKQSERTRSNWRLGKMDFLRKRQVYACQRTGCDQTFEAIPADKKRYCSKSCAATMNNAKRTLSLETRNKISRALAGRVYPERRKPPVMRACIQCREMFPIKFWRPASRPTRYCSVRCLMQDVGRRPTSPKAARAKAGIRPDISPDIYFFSRWEANYARVLNYKGIKWVHQPKTFQLESQRYTPDFYLPESNTYVEIKNYMSPYSQRRDDEFRKLYPTIKLVVILKEEYLKLQKKFSGKISQWEFNKSPIP